MITQLLGSAVASFLATLVGAAIDGGPTVTGAGGLLSFAIGAAVFGAVLEQHLG